MAEIAETQLPGVGVRYEFTTSVTILHLSPEDARTLVETEPPRRNER